MDWSSLALALFGIFITVFIAVRQEWVLQLLAKNLERVRRDQDKRIRLEKFFRAGKNRRFMIVYPSYFHGKPVDTVWAGDFFALMTLNDALTAIIPEKTFELKSVSPHEEFSREAIPDRDLIFVCSPRANSMLSAAFPTPHVHKDDDRTELQMNAVAKELPCWFVEDYTYSDTQIAWMRAPNTTKTLLTTASGKVEAAVKDASGITTGDMVTCANVPQGTTVSALNGNRVTLALPPDARGEDIKEGTELEATFTRPILMIYDLTRPAADALVSPAEKAYWQATQAFALGQKTFIPNPKSQKDYGIILRTQKANGRYAFVIAGIHQYGTFMAARYLQDLFDPDQPLEEHALGDDDFVIVIEGEFSHEHFRVGESPTIHGSWIWSRSKTGGWEQRKTRQMIVPSSHRGLARELYKSFIARYSGR